MVIVQLRGLPLAAAAVAASTPTPATFNNKIILRVGSGSLLLLLRLSSRVSFEFAAGVRHSQGALL